MSQNTVNFDRLAAFYSDIISALRKPDVIPLASQKKWIALNASFFNFDRSVRYLKKLLLSPNQPQHFVMYTRKELCIMYQVGAQKLGRVLKQAGITSSYKMITPLEFEKLKKTIGEPIKGI